MKETKRVFKLFWAWQDEAEEKWLGMMAEKGWHVKKYLPFVYIFEKGPEEKIIYKSDFNPTKTIDRTEYFSLFKDAGWEPVFEYMGWHYFKSTPGATKTSDIFSDKESKVQKYKRLMSLLTSIFVIIIAIAVTIVFPSHKDDMDPMKWIYIFLIVFLGFAVFKTFFKIKKIRRG